MKMIDRFIKDDFDGFQYVKLWRSTYALDHVMPVRQHSQQSSSSSVQKIPNHCQIYLDEINCFESFVGTSFLIHLTKQTNKLNMW